MYIKYERTDGRGDDKPGLVKEPPPWSARLFSGTSVSYLRAVPRVGRGRSTPTSRIRLRPSVLDRHPVPLRGVEALNRSRVQASSPVPLYHRYLEPVLGTVGGPCSSPCSGSKGSTRTVHTTPAHLGVFVLHWYPDLEDPQGSSEKTVFYLRVRTRRDE